MTLDFDHPGSASFIERMLISSFDETNVAVSEKARWRNEPAAWAHDRASAYLWSKQTEIMEAVRDHTRVAVHSCHNIGKTYIAAHVAGWFLDVHAPGTAFVLTTAPTSPQVKALLWREINRLHARAGLPGRVNLSEWYLDNELVAFGRKPSEYNETAFQGIHARHVLVIMDEASGIPVTLWTAAETIASNRYGRILAIGNPDVSDGEFELKCRPESGWKTIHVGYQHSPNFTDEDVPDELREQLISPEWVERMRIEWGEDSALFQSKVLGVFPRGDSDPWTVIPHRMVAPCRLLELPESEPVEAGIDVGAGGDRTVIVERRGQRVGRIDAFQSADPMASVGRLIEKINEWGVTRVKIDVIGVGWGVYGRLRELSTLHNPAAGESGDTAHAAEVVSVNFAERSRYPKRFLNKRAEVWWLVGREKSRIGTWDLSTLDDDAIAELTVPRYEILDSMGRIKIESKDEVKKRLRRSPDVADSLLLAFYEGAAAGPAATGAVDTFRRSGIMNGGSGGSSPFGARQPGRVTVFGGQ